jgi:hypothetical protein
MEMSDIRAFIFADRTSEMVTTKTLRAWMDDGRLHAIQVAAKAYDVRITDLEALRTVKNPGADSV